MTPLSSLKARLIMNLAAGRAMAGRICPNRCIAGHMTPHPPHLPPEIPKWQSEELFYIVKHGVKFTGMPAWPAQQRDDEVWAVVAFLLKLPKLTAQEYLKLARSLKAPAATIDDLTESKQAPRIITDNCARCHAVDNGTRDLSAFPILAGQRPDYLFASLLAFARGERHSGIMEPLAASLTATDMREIAQYYATYRRRSQRRCRRRSPRPLNAAERSRCAASRVGAFPHAAHVMVPTRSDETRFTPSSPANIQTTSLCSSNLFNKQSRGGTPYAHIMHRVAGRLTPEQMRDVTLYYGSLSSAAEPAAR